MSVDAIKVSAKQLALLPLPEPSEEWNAAAGHAQSASLATTEPDRETELIALGKAMNEAYGVDDQLLVWWSQRLGVEHVSS